MTPHEVMLCFEGYKNQKEQEKEWQNTMMYIQGRYFVDALLCTVGNMFSKKGARQIKYPKEPYQISEPRELTQAEKDAQVKELFGNLMLMKENFDKTHGKSGSGN